MSCAFVCAFILVGSVYVRDDVYNADILSSTYMRASETAASIFFTTKTERRASAD